MKNLIFLLILFVLCMGIGWVTSTADKEDYEYVRIYIQDSPEAQQKFLEFISAHNTPTRYELIKFRQSMKPLVIETERAKKK